MTVLLYRAHHATESGDGGGTVLFYGIGGSFYCTVYFMPERGIRGGGGGCTNCSADDGYGV